MAIASQPAGNENVAVQINGRPTPITGAQLSAYLKQIPANIVERIEVVPNPSAKYDPEGMAASLISSSRRTQILV
jgi:hypothetical protein